MSNEQGENDRVYNAKVIERASEVFVVQIGNLREILAKK